MNSKLTNAGSRNHPIIIFSALLILLGMILRYSGLNFVSIDMKNFLFHWYDTMALNSFSALKDSFSNYTPPYLYLLGLATATQSFLPKIISIKAISILFDLINAVIVFKIIQIKRPQKVVALLGAGVFLLLPTILLNSAYWGQADAIYSCFLLTCLYFILSDRPLRAIIFFSVAFSFKAQSIFLLPFLALLIIKKRIPWFYLGIIPIIYSAMMLPALMVGRPFLELMTIYASQANSYRFLTLSSPNIYVFIPNDFYGLFVQIGILVTVVITAIWMAIYAYKIKTFTPETIILSSLASVVIIPFFLPKMHDRYFYLADILSLLAAFYVGKAWFLALGFQITSGLAYSIFLLYPQTEPYKETILITAAMINTALIVSLLYMQWNLTKQDSILSLGNNHKTKLDVVMNKFSSFRAGLAGILSPIKPYSLFLLILAIGTAVRLWNPSLPPGLNPDEASIGVEAYYLYKYGVDRNGISYPVHLISWGSGQNALYAYLILPLVALKGLTTASIRLPMLLSGLLSMPLVYLAGKKLFGEKFGLLAMFFMASSPWHIINSRWAVESNIMPFLFLTGFTLLVFSSPKNNWFTLACAFFASCLYAYGTAYAGVPVFLSLAIPALIYTKQITFKQAIAGLTVFFALALPIALFVIINTFQYDAIHLGLVTIPRMPVEARYETMAAVFGSSPLQTMSENIGIMFKMLWTQEDAYPWNHVRPFGYFYKITFPLVVMGFLLAIPRKAHPEGNTGRWLLLAWIFASLVIGVIHPTNLTRLNLIFTPILLCIALFILEMDKHIKRFLHVASFVLLIGFVLFIRTYHGEEYQKRASGVFNSGMIPAVEFASEKGKSSICFTEAAYSSYIYVLFTQKTHPSEYINNIEWLYPSDPTDPARTPREIGRYHFRLSDCSKDKDAVYILLLKESPPNQDVKYKSKKFDKFRVYFPQE